MQDHSCFYLRAPEEPIGSKSYFVVVLVTLPQICEIWEIRKTFCIVYLTCTSYIPSILCEWVMSDTFQACFIYIKACNYLHFISLISSPIGYNT